MVHQLLPEPTKQNLQLLWRSLFTCVYQQTASHSPHIQTHNITKMNEVLSRTQPYIQLEETMKASSNHSVKLSDDGGKSKSTHETPNHAQARHRGQLPYKKQVLPYSPTKSTLKLQIDEMLHSFEAPDQHGFQHLQRSAVGQTPEIDPTQSLAFRVRGILLLPWM